MHALFPYSFSFDPSLWWHQYSFHHRKATLRLSSHIMPQHVQHMLFADLQCWFTVKPEKKEEKSVMLYLSTCLMALVVIGIQWSKPMKWMLELLEVVDTVNSKRGSQCVLKNLKGGGLNLTTLSWKLSMTKINYKSHEQIALLVILVQYCHSTYFVTFVYLKFITSYDTTRNQK